jgi:chromosome segregation ATPase
VCFVRHTTFLVGEDGTGKTMGNTKIEEEIHVLITRRNSLQKIQDKNRKMIESIKAEIASFTKDLDHELFDVRMYKTQVVMNLETYEFAKDSISTNRDAIETLQKNLRENLADHATHVEELAQLAEKISEAEDRNARMGVVLPFRPKAR